MSGVWWVLATILALIVLVIGKVVLDLVNKQVQGWLAELPLQVLRLARKRLPAELRDELYDQLGLEAELETILHHTYATKPITALVKGFTFAFGHVVGLRRCARILGAPSVMAKLKAILLRRRDRPLEQSELEPDQLMALIRTRLIEQYGSETVAKTGDNRGVRLTFATHGLRDVDIADLIYQYDDTTYIMQVKTLGFIGMCPGRPMQE